MGKITINDIVDELLKIKKEFIIETYNETSNKAFINSSYSKEYKIDKLYNLYKVEKIEFNFNQPGIIFHKFIEELNSISYFTNASIYYLITSGEDTINDLLCSLYLINNVPSFLIWKDNHCILFRGINKVYKSQDLLSNDPHLFLDNIFDGGEAFFKKCVKDFNNKVSDINKKIYDYCYALF